MTFLNPRCLTAPKKAAPIVDILRVAKKKHISKSEKQKIFRVFCSYSYFDVTITAFDGKKAFKPVIVTSKLL